MATTAVIEQAKGIMMAQQGCGPEQAFDLLRHASQRANLKVHLMAQIIAHGHLGQRVLEPRPELAEQVERVRRTAGPYRWYSMAAPPPATWSDRTQVTGDDLPVVAFASRASCLSCASARRRVGGLPRCTIRSRRMAAYPSVDKANTISRSVTWRGSVLRRSLRNGR